MQDEVDKVADLAPKRTPLQKKGGGPLPKGISVQLMRAFREDENTAKCRASPSLIKALNLTLGGPVRIEADAVVPFSVSWIDISWIIINNY